MQGKIYLKDKDYHISNRYYDIGFVRIFGYARTISTFRIDDFVHGNAADSVAGGLCIVVNNRKENVAFVFRVHYKQDVGIATLCDNMSRYMRGAT